MPALSDNRKVYYEYDLMERFEAGIVLSGQEVKSSKSGRISIKGSFITAKGNELFLTNANIPPYPHAGVLKNYDPTRPRKLLLKKNEINHLVGKIKIQGLTIVPLKVYTKKRLIKLELSVARGKKKYDKREAIKKREAGRKMERILKNQ
jgi:SsrA-binding protein